MKFYQITNKQRTLQSHNPRQLVDIIFDKDTIENRNNCWYKKK